MWIYCMKLCATCLHHQTNEKLLIHYSYELLSLLFKSMTDIVCKGSYINWFHFKISTSNLFIVESNWFLDHIDRCFFFQWLVCGYDVLKRENGCLHWWLCLGVFFFFLAMLFSLLWLIICIVYPPIEDSWS